MSILIDNNTKILTQGMTGNTGSFHTNQGLAYYGTKMVGGIHPKKGGTMWQADNGTELPIFATVAEGKERPVPPRPWSTSRPQALLRPLKKPSTRKSR